MTIINSDVNKQIIVISTNLCLSNSIQENLPEVNIQFIAHKGDVMLDIYPKIDLLIIDNEDFKLKDTDRHKIKTIINIKNKENFSKDYITFLKPFKLDNLLQLILQELKSEDIFCILNQNYIYNEKLHTVTGKGILIKLTEKENKIFESLLSTPNFSIKKEFLLKNIWNYHEDSRSLTVDTHLYKLKTKLPYGMLEIKNNICHLNITK